jgi:long-chain acyl-CoA synthetase
MQLSSLLAHHARYRPHATAVVFEEQRLDYSEFSARIDRVAHALLGLGIGKGERVASLLPNCLELLDLYWACARIGAVAVPLSPLLTGTGLASLIADAGARCLLTRREFLPMVEKVLHELPTLAPERVLLTNATLPPWGDYAALAAAAPDGPPPDAGVAA